jgi:hypothetical protein
MEVRGGTVEACSCNESIQADRKSRSPEESSMSGKRRGLRPSPKGSQMNALPACGRPCSALPRPYQDCELEEAWQRSCLLRISC